MNKKIITIVVAGILLSSVFTPITFASEISGNLSSNGSLIQGQSTSGTLSGSVVGGVTNVATHGGGGGGRPYIPPVTTTVNTNTLPINNTNDVSSDGNAFVAYAAGTTSNVGTPYGNNGSPAVTDTTPGVDEPTELALADQDTSSVIGAYAVGSKPSNTAIAWILSFLIIVLIVSYGFYRKYRNKHNKFAFNKLSN
jgi:hypothetical protein